jgi:hypothetical protein
MQTEITSADEMTLEWRGHYSLDNGATWHRASDAAIEDHELERKWDSLVAAMDDEIRERVHTEEVGSSPRAFLAAYLEQADRGLMIG